jgi:hypothetical protein
MTNRMNLYALSLITALSGLFGGHFMARHVSAVLMARFAFELMFNFVSFVWYCRDSDARSFIRSRWLSVAMVCVPVLAIPWYLLRSRPKGKRGKAILRFVGFLFLLACVGVAGMVTGELLA